MFEGVWKESLEQEKMRRFPFMPWKNHQVPSILVIHQGALGDFILALPALEPLRKAFPQAKLNSGFKHDYFLGKMADGASLKTSKP